MQVRTRRTTVMSDFTSGFWSIYVIVLVVASIAGCAWLLWVTGKVKVSAPKGAAKAAPAGREPGGGDRPRLGRRPAGVQQSVAEMVVEPVLAHDRLRRRLPRAVSGTGQPSRACWAGRRRGAYQTETKDFDAKVQPLYDKYSAMEIPQIAADPAARQTGERLFLTYCSPCHGSDAGGSQGLSRTCATATGSMAANRRTSSRRSPAGAWA